MDVVSCSVTVVSCNAEEEGVRLSGLLFEVTPERKRLSERAACPVCTKERKREREID